MTGVACAEEVNSARTACISRVSAVALQEGVCWFDPGMLYGPSVVRQFVSCLLSWEARIKAVKKPRRRRNPNPSPNPDASGKCSRLHRQSRPPNRVVRHRRQRCRGIDGGSQSQTIPTQHRCVAHSKSAHIKASPLHMERACSRCGNMCRAIMAVPQ